MAFHFPGRAPSVQPIDSSQTLSTPAPVPTIPATPQPKRRWILWTSIATVALLLGGGYFAYSRGYIAIPFLSPNSDELFDRLVDSLGKIDNAQYTLKASLKAEPRAAGATSIFPTAEEKKSADQDDQRRSDLAQIRTGLVLYFDDNNRYPDSLSGTLSPTYLNKLPTDPVDKSDYSYLVCDGGQHFVLYTGLELGEYYSITDQGSSKTTTAAPTCSATKNTNVSGFLPWLIPTAHAQATTFSVESIGIQTGLGTAPTDNLPLVNLFGIFGLEDMDSLIDVFPNDIDTSAAFTFYTEADKKLKEADALLQIVASYHGGDLTAEFDVEGRKNGTTVYGIIRKFPGIPYLSQFVTPIKNKWVKITPDDGNTFLNKDAWGDSSIKEGVEKTKESLKLVLQGEAFTADRKLGTDSIAGVQSVHYRLALHPDKLKGIFEKIVAERKEKKQSTSELETAMRELDRPNVQASLQRFVDNSTVDIWIDKAQGLLRQISWNVVVVPPEGSTKLKDKQFTIGLTLTLDKVNKRVAVNAPGGAIGYDEAERLVTGISVEEQLFSRQRSRIYGIRRALDGIKEAGGDYPTSIDNLADDWKQAIKDCEENKKSSANANLVNIPYVYCGYYYGSGNDFQNLDVYTKKPFVYKRTTNDYELTYEMRLDFTDSDSEYSYGSYYKEQFSEGTNTATSKDVSIEQQTEDEQAAADRAKNTNTTVVNRNTSIVNTNTAVSNTNSTPLPTITDSDFDGLTDTFEATIGTNSNKIDSDDDGLNDYVEYYTCSTNPNSKDTDGDTYDDRTEIMNGYNPNGAGAATNTYCKTYITGI